MSSVYDSGDALPLLQSCTLPRCSIPHLCGAIPADEKYRCKPTDQVHDAPWVVGHVTCYQCSYRSQPECVQRTGRSSGFWQRCFHTAPRITGTQWMTLMRRGTMNRGVCVRVYVSIMYVCRYACVCK